MTKSTNSDASSHSEDVTRRQLEEAILADPSDLGAHAAYADFLMEQGDPQGEFIQAELALRDDSLSAGERQKLQARSDALLEKHYEEWVGDWVHCCSLDAELVPEDSQAQKRRRFINGIFAEIDVERMCFQRVQKIMDSPQTRLVRNLRIGSFWDADDELNEEVDLPEELEVFEFPAGELLMRWDGLKNLRLFQFGLTPEEDYAENCPFWCSESLENAPELVEKMTSLEELYLFAHRVPERILFQLPMPNLRILQLYHGIEYPIEELAMNRSLTNLTHILLHPHGLAHDQAYLQIGGLESILASPNLPSLTHLRVRLADFGNEGCRAIVESGILKRLKVLDLRHGCITDVGAKMLAECEDITHLEHLDLQSNYLTAEGIESLKRTGVSLNAKCQYEGEIDWNNLQWLYQGDWE